MDTVVFRNYRHARARTSDFGGPAALLGNRYKLVAPESDRPGTLRRAGRPRREQRPGRRASRTVAAEMEKGLRAWQRSVEVSLAGADYVKA